MFSLGFRWLPVAQPEEMAMVPKDLGTGSTCRIGTLTRVHPALLHRHRPQKWLHISSLNHPVPGTQSLRILKLAPSSLSHSQTLEMPFAGPGASDKAQASRYPELTSLKVLVEEETQATIKARLEVLCADVHWTPAYMLSS